MHTPYLSIVATSRNDNHGGNLNLRMQVFVNALLALAEKHKLSTELLLVDWPPPVGKPALADVLVWPRHHEYCSVRVIEVPPAIHNTYKHAARLPLYQMIGKNVGVRRAKGEFVLCTNVDIVFSDELFAFLATRTLESQTSYRSDRHDAGNTLEAAWPLEQVLEHCRNNLIRINMHDASINLSTNQRHAVYPPGASEASLGYPPLHTNGCGDFTLLSREDWFRLRGYIERDIFSFHLDSLFLYEAHYGGCREEIPPPTMVHYHIEHEEGWTPEIHGAGTLERHLKQSSIERLSNEDLKSLIAEMAASKRPLATNDEDWGLVRHDLTERYVTVADWEHATLPVPDAGTESPYLSFVVTLRNDDHGGNMVPRFQTFLDHLNDMCERHSLPSELIVVEWNPIPGKDSIAQVMKWPDSARVQTRIIVVPPHVHAAHENHDKFPLFQMIGKNAGIRRARGEFVLATNIDLVFSDELFAFLARRQLDPSCFYRIDRHDIGATSIPDTLSWQERLAFCEQNLIRVQAQHGTHAWGAQRPEGKPDALHTNACGDFTLLSREAWHALKAYPEFHLWSIFIDGLLIHAAIAAGLKQMVLKDPCRVYHIEHDMGWAKTQAPIHERPSLDYHKQYQPLCQGMLARKKPLDINSENWGLADLPLEEVRPCANAAPACGTHEKENDTLAVFKLWIKTIAAIDNRLYYRDQSAESLQSLVDLARRHNPTVIIELGTLSGLSLRAWLMATDTARVHAVDLNFNPLKESAKHFPVDFSRVTLHEQDILTLDFPSLWTSEDRVLFFVDAHDLPNVPIMEHVLNNALPALPRGSMVVVDDLWHSAERLTHNTAKAYVAAEQVVRIDELQCFSCHYAPYHKGGSFLGFREVVPFLEFINKRGVALQFAQEGKHVWFDWDADAHACRTETSPQHDAAEWGEADYNPLQMESAPPLTRKILMSAQQLYRQGKIREVISLLEDLLQSEQSAEGCLALAICAGRLGGLTEAYRLACAARRLDGNNRRAERLSRDLAARLGVETFPKTESKGVTIYAAPKAFIGHTAIIQKNAIRSWVRLTPRPEIILLGDEEGIAEMAQEVNALHIPDLARNEFGTPLLDDLIYTATSMARNDTLAYVNSDIILFDDFMSGIAKARAVHNEMLLIGRRWDMNVVEEINFDDPGWRQTLLDDMAKNGFLHFETGIDYFVHNKGLWVGMPPFALGRCAWDNWLVGSPLSMGKAVIDTTEYITAIHQDHGYAHGGGRKKVFEGVEAQRNKAMAQSVLGFTSDAVRYMTSDGEVASRSPLPALHRSPQAISDRVRWLVIQANKLQNRGCIDLAISKYEEASWSEPDNCRLAEVLNSLRERQAC